MPNTPAMIGEGVAGLFPFSKAVTREDREQTETVLGRSAATVWITDESQMDAVTAISGSGPATCSTSSRRSRTPRGSWTPGADRAPARV